MAVGKYISLEEARKAKKLERVAKAEPLSHPQRLFGQPYSDSYLGY